MEERQTSPPDVVVQPPLPPYPITDTPIYQQQQPVPYPQPPTYQQGPPLPPQNYQQPYPQQGQLPPQPGYNYQGAPPPTPPGYYNQYPNQPPMGVPVQQQQNGPMMAMSMGPGGVQVLQSEHI